MMPSPSALHASDESTFTRIGFYALQLYLFFYMSRVLEFLPSMKITLILNVVFLGAAVLGGEFLAVLRSRIGILLAAFFGWMTLSLPFSVWKGGSVETMTGALRSLILMTCIVALATSTEKCLKLMYAIGFAAAATATLSRFFGSVSDTGRLELRWGSLSDPNMYSVMLVIGLPFLWLRARRSQNILWKLFALGCTVPILITTLGTGSRTGFLALVGASILMFLRAAPTRKPLILICGAALTIAAFSLYPDAILQRYTTFVTAEVSPEATSEDDISALRVAAASGAGRLHLLTRSLELTARNPILGVGPGMFAVAENDYARALGARRGMWHETHNTLTQVSSETGIPGFLFFSLALFFTALTIWRIPNMQPAQPSPEWQQARQAAIYLQMTLLATLIASCFLSMAYWGTTYVVVGLVMALQRAVNREFFTPATTQPEPRQPESRIGMALRRPVGPAPPARRSTGPMRWDARNFLP